MGTLDAHLLALDRDSGRIVWDTVLDDFKLGHAAIAAPLVVKDKVITGNSGGDIPTRGFIDAYDAKTGKRAWRFYTIPAKGEPGSETWSNEEVLPRGGGATWVTGTYDPELNLIYWGVGNPNPDYWGPSVRAAISIRHRSSRSTPTPASCAGTISSRRTISTTGTRITFRCSARSRSTARCARW
jgi:glucose dehydrogenase